MKKTLLAIAVVATLFSCSKDEETTDFVATTTTGNATITGIVTAQEFNTNGTFALEGVQVTAVVPRTGNGGIYPNSNANLTLPVNNVFTTTTDANGRYTLNITSNARGVNVTITYGHVQVVVDSANGESVTYSRAGSTNGSANSINDITINGLVTGVTESRNVLFTRNTTLSPVDVTVETAVIRGKVEIERLQQQDSLTSMNYVAETTPLANHPVTLVFTNDPTTFEDRTYTTTTDANGNYSITVDVAGPSSETAFARNFDVWVGDHSSTRDTVTFNTVVVTGDAGVFPSPANQTGTVAAGDIDNQNDFTYTVGSFRKD